MAALTLPCAAFAGAYGDMFKNGHLRFDYTPQEISALEERAAKELDINLNFLAAIPADRRDFTCARVGGCLYLVLVCAEEFIALIVFSPRFCRARSRR